MDQDITLGEIGRGLDRLEAVQSQQGMILSEIREQVIRTNGRVTGHDRELRDLRVQPEGVSLTMSNQLWLGIVAIATVVSPLLVEWIKQWL